MNCYGECECRRCYAPSVKDGVTTLKEALQEWWFYYKRNTLRNLTPWGRAKNLQELKNKLGVSNEHHLRSSSK